MGLQPDSSVVSAIRIFPEALPVQVEYAEWKGHRRVARMPASWRSRMNRRIGSVPVALLAITLPVFWLSGAEMANLPAQLYATQSGTPLDWLLPLIAGILLVGFLLSRLA